MSSKSAKKKTLIVGLEFDKITHRERLVLNQNLAKMEQILYPDESPESQTDSKDIWRGERRRYHRLDIEKLGLKARVDLSTVQGGIYHDVLLINLSPTGCCIKMPFNASVEPGSRIPRFVIPLPDEALVLRARVAHLE
jgi:hypothetical protein